MTFAAWLVGIEKMMGCTNKIACQGFPGTTQSYYYRFVLWDTGCYSGFSSPACIVGQATTPVVSTINWIEQDAGLTIDYIPPSPLAPLMAAISSPNGIFTAAPWVGTPCTTRRAAQMMTYMMSLMGATALNGGYCN